MKKNLLLFLTLSFLCLNANENELDNDAQENQATTEENQVVTNQEDAMPETTEELESMNRSWYDPIKNGYYSALSVIKNLVNQVSNNNNSTSEVAEQAGNISGEVAQDFLDDYLNLPIAVTIGNTIDNAVTETVDFAVEQVNNFLGSSYGQNIFDTSSYHSEIVDNLYKISLPNLVRNNSTESINVEMVESMLNVSNKIPVGPNVFVIVSYLLNIPTGVLLDLEKTVVEVADNRINLSMPMLPAIEDVQSLDVPEVVPAQPEVPAVEDLDASNVTEELPALEEPVEASEVVESLVDTLSDATDRSHNVSGHLKIAVFSK